MSDDSFTPPKKVLEKQQPDIVVTQSKLKRGRLNVKHGFYRKALTKEEVEVAEDIEEAIRETYKLDDVVDAMMLSTAVTAFVKSLRTVDDEYFADYSRSGKEKVVQMQAFWAKQFKDFIESLGLNRKVRQGLGGDDDAIMATFAKLRPKQE